MKTYIDSARAEICCFSGYRPEKLPWGTKENDPRCVKLKEKIRSEVDRLYNTGVRHFICGMARGSDTYFCEAVIDARANYRDITIEAAIPCETQASSWSEADRSRYFSLIAQCDRETYVSRKYTHDCMIRRNKYMVDCSGVLLSVFDGRFGGTMQTITYASRSGLLIIEIEP